MNHNVAAASTNEAIILGAGMDFQEEDPDVLLNAESQQRVARFIQYYGEHPHEFSAREAFVICSGGYGLLASGVEEPTDGRPREGILMADSLVQSGVPHRLICVESRSTSTLTNFTESVAQGFLDLTRYDADHKLGVVSHPPHLKRAAVMAGKLGLEREALAFIPTQEQGQRMREFVLRTAYRALLVGAHGSEQLQRRERLLEVALGAMRGRRSE